jgi:hypothetical protein
MEYGTSSACPPDFLIEACFSIDLEKELIKTKGGKGVCDQSSFFSTTSKQR